MGCKAVIAVKVETAACSCVMFSGFRANCDAGAATPDCLLLPLLPKRPNLKLWVGHRQIFNQLTCFFSLTRASAGLMLIALVFIKISSAFYFGCGNRNQSEVFHSALFF